MKDLYQSQENYVRIFKSLIIFLPCALVAQSDLTVAINGDSAFTAAGFDKIESQLRTQIDTGKEFSKFIRLDSVNSPDLVLYYGVYENPVYLDSIVYKYAGEPLLTSNVQTQIFRSLLLSQPGPTFDSRLDAIRSNYSFFPRKIDHMYMRYDNDKIGAVILMDPDFTSYFSGLAGAARSDAQGWNVTGELNIHVENLWKTAGTVSLDWKRPDSLSQQLSFELIEPHPYGWPVGIGLRYDQNLWNGEYIRTESSGTIKLRTLTSGSMSVGVRKKMVRPTEDGKINGLNYSETNYLVFESSGDNRNDKWLPDRGLYWKAETAFGTRKSKEDTESGTILLRAINYFNVSRTFTAEAGIQADYLWLSSGVIERSDMYHLGGANSLRGYQESRFIVPWYGLFSFELQYRSGPGSRLFGFVDNAIYGENADWLGSYGVGYIQKTGNTVLELAYGLTGRESYLEGKVHFKFLTYF